jgi:hypothetical protein
MLHRTFLGRLAKKRTFLGRPKMISWLVFPTGSNEAYVEINHFYGQVVFPTGS